MSITVTVPTTIFTYDDQGRLSSATYPDTTVISYAYDLAGNRTQIGGGGGPPVANAVNANVAENSTNNPIGLNITGGTPTSVAVSTQATHGAATASGISITLGDS